MRLTDERILELFRGEAMTADDNQSVGNVIIATVRKCLAIAAQPAAPVLENGLTEAETNATASVMGLSKPAIPPGCVVVKDEPVAWIEHHKAGDNLNWDRADHPYAKATPLYARPGAPK